MCDAKRLADAIQATGGGLVLVVTGAGISLASGIPTFRGTDPGAVWKSEGGGGVAGSDHHLPDQATHPANGSGPTHNGREGRKVRRRPLRLHRIRPRRSRRPRRTLHHRNWNRPNCGEPISMGSGYSYLPEL